jgi:hypothetical protein
MNDLQSDRRRRTLEGARNGLNMAIEFKTLDEMFFFRNGPKNTHGIQQARPPTSPGIKRMRLPASKFMSAMSAALTSWSFTKTQEP